MLTIQDVTFSYGRKQQPVLSNFSLKIEPGMVYGLLGPNGAGKTTLLYLIAGLLKPQVGEIAYNGISPWGRSIEFLSDIFIVPEEFVLPNVALKDYLATTAPFYPKFSMDKLLEHLAIFELTPDVHLGKLSMGQKKRVFISFALACNTSLLLLDEPTNGLDIPGKRLFRKAVLNGMTDERTIIISTHQVFDVEKIIDHVLIIDRLGLKIDASLMDIARRWKFLFTTDRERASKAILALDAPGGYNIVEPADGEESDVNLETLFELVRRYSELCNDSPGAV